MVATKAQELKALDQIKKIVEGLGPDSYIGTAFEGCFEIAEDNIGNDFARSMKQIAESSMKLANERYEEIAELKAELKKADDKIENLQEELDRELQWHDCEGGTNVSQEEYLRIKSSRSSRELTDDEAKDIINKEFGFAQDKITIITEVKTYQANKYHRMRPKDTYERPALYDSTDWNYIRFDCAGWMWEMYNGELCRYER